jgi:hypothetical protein
MKVTFLFVIFSVWSISAVRAPPALSEWKMLEQADTLDVFYKDHIVGALVHGIVVLDSARGITSTTSMSVAGKDAGIAQMELFEQRVYNFDGSLRSAREVLKSPSGTTTWTLYETPQGWRSSIETGGETSANIIDSVDESLLPLLDLTVRARKMLVAKGETWRDTEKDLVSGKSLANVYKCTAIDSAAKIVTFDVTDNITGRHQAWQLDANGKTIMEEVEGIFVAKKASGAQKRKRGEAVADLEDLLSVPVSRSALLGERIAVVLPPDAEMNASVAPLYIHKGERWILASPAQACTCRVASGAPDSSLSEFTKATPTLQANHPSIVRLAQKIQGSERDQCTILGLFTKYVFSSLEKRQSITFSNALETLKAGFGDCGEHAVLLAALLRSAGIPARVVLGLIYDSSKKAYAGHAWVMAWTGSWLFADPAFGVFPACKDRIPLMIDDNGRNAVLLTKLLGKIRVEYVQE